FVDEIREAHLDVAGLGLEPLDHLLEDHLEGLRRDLALMRVQDLDEARHVSAFEVMRQSHVHVEGGDGVLRAAAALGHADWMPDRLDPDLVDGELAPVLGALDVGDGSRVAYVHERSVWDDSYRRHAAGNCTS